MTAGGRALRVGASPRSGMLTDSVSEPAAGFRAASGLPGTRLTREFLAPRRSVSILPGMRPVWRRSAVLAVLVALAGASAFPPEARAAEPALEVDPASKKKAAKKFREGERAYQRHDYPKAAAAFEEAYAIAPHPAALFNAARAYQKAGELTRAANLTARYLQSADESEKRRAQANALLSELTPKLGRIEVTAESAEDVSIDDAPVELETTFVDPGDHVVSGVFDGERVERKMEVVAGSLARVILEPPAPEPDVPPQPYGEGHDEAAQKDAPASRKGLPPTVVYVGAGATAFFAGLTIWSGLDTNAAREDYDQNPTQQGLDEGEAKQSRTNLFLGVTAVLGVGTGVVALLFTDWSDEPASQESVELGVGPGSVFVTGRF